MAYYGRSASLVAHGGMSGRAPGGERFDTRVWDGTDWTQQPLRFSRVRTVAEHAMVYDAGRDRPVMFGGGVAGPYGCSYQNGTHEWTGLWLDNLAPQNPPARKGHAMAYDSRRGRVVLYGGDTWEMHSYTPAPPFVQPSIGYFGAGCPGPVVAPYLVRTTTAFPWVGSSWSVAMSAGSPFGPPVPVALMVGLSNATWGSVPLPLSLASIGAPGCNLLVSPNFLLPGVTPAGANWVLPLPRCPGCAGTTFYLQGLAIQKGQLSVTNGMEIVLGRQ